MTQQLTPNQKKWIKALRSGDYTQTTGFLHNELSRLRFQLLSRPLSGTSGLTGMTKFLKDRGK
jgi:hypothetical protein